MSRWKIYPLVFALIGFACSMTVDAGSWSGWGQGGSRRHKPIVVSATTTTTQPAAYDYVPFESATMTASNVPSPVVAYASSEYSAAYAGWKAFDRVWGNAGCWQDVSGGRPDYLLYDCGAGNSNVVMTLEMLGYSDPTYNPNAFTFSGSQDGVTYITNFSTNATSSLYQSFVNPNPNYYRFYKMYITSGFNGSYTLVAELALSSADFFSPQMTASNAPSPCVASASSAYDATYLAWKAFDRRDTSWQSGNGSNFPHWIKYNFGSNVVINGFTISVPALNYALSNYVFAASTDDSTYITLNTGTMVNTVATQLFTNNNTTAYQYYKLTGSAGNPNGYAQITEMKIGHYK